MVIINQIHKPYQYISNLKHWFGLIAQDALAVDFIDCGFSRAGAKRELYLIIFS